LVNSFLVEIKMQIIKFFSILFLMILINENVIAQNKNTKTTSTEKKLEDEAFSETATENSDVNLEQDDTESSSGGFTNYALVQILNKTTAKTSFTELKINDKTNFGSIKIIPHKCWQSPLEQKPESKILLEVFETKNEGKDKITEKRIFYGWMFASSPSISGLEHPIYDITAINCFNK